MKIRSELATVQEWLEAHPDIEPISVEAGPTCSRPTLHIWEADWHPLVGGLGEAWDPNTDQRHRKHQDGGVLLVAILTSLPACPTCAIPGERR